MPRSRAGFACACRALATTASIKAFGLDVVTDLCEQLVAGGAPSIHFYTMNRAWPRWRCASDWGCTRTSTFMNATVRHWVVAGLMIFSTAVFAQERPKIGLVLGVAVPVAPRISGCWRN